MFQQLDFTPGAAMRFACGFLAVVLCFSSIPAHAQGGDAKPWLEKMMGVYDDGPFTVDYTAKLDLAQMGQPINGTLDGKITFGDREHTRMEMTMSLGGMPGMTGGEGGEGMQMKMLSVNDGTMTWTEIEMPAMGTRQVMKISTEDAAKLAASQGFGGLATNPTSMDPVAQLEMLAELIEFELVEATGGRVTLRGKVTADAQEGLGQLGALGVDTFVLVLDEKTAFPVEMRFGDPTPVILMEFQNLKRMSESALPQGIFEYTPPEGVPVMDLAEMLKGMGG